MKLRSGTRAGEWLEGVFVAIALCWAARAFDLALYGRAPRNTAPHPDLAWGLLVFVLGMSSVFALRDRSRFTPHWRQLSLPLFVVLVALASVAWSQSALDTARGSLAFLATTGLGLWFAHRTDSTRQLEWVASVLAILGGLSWLLVAAWPAVGLEVEYRGTNWAGVFADRNTLGSRMALGCMLCGLLAAAGRRPAAFGIGAAVCGIGLAGSGARTAQVSVAVGLLCLGSAMLLRSGRRPWIWGLGFVALVGVGVALGGSARFVEFLGRDLTFSDRTEVWSALLQPAREHVWLGHGFNAFWPDAAAAQWFDLGRTPLHAHNGWLDLQLELGLAGVLVFLVGLGIFARRWFGALRTRNGILSLWPGVFLAMFLVQNAMGSALVRQNRIEWVLLVAAMVQAQRRRNPSEEGPYPRA